MLMTLKWSSTSCLSAFHALHIPSNIKQFSVYAVMHAAQCRSAILLYRKQSKQSIACMSILMLSGEFYCNKVELSKTNREYMLS